MLTESNDPKENDKKKKVSPHLEKQEAWVCPPRLRSEVGPALRTEGKAVSQSPGAHRGSGGWKASLTSEHRHVSTRVDVVEQGSQGLCLRP